MKRIVLILCVASMMLTLNAQNKDSDMLIRLEDAKAKLVDFDTEHMIDSLDQEKLPRLVSGGLLAGANISNFIIT